MRSPKDPALYLRIALVVPLALLTVIQPGSGQTWTQSSAPTKNWVGIASSADGAKWVAAAGESVVNQQPVFQGIYTSTNPAASWALSSAPITNWSAVASSADGGTLVAAGGSRGIYISLDSGASWTTNTAPTFLTGIASSANGTTLVAIYQNAAAYSHDQIWHSTNAATTWAQAGVPDSVWNSVASSADGSKLVAVGTWIFTSSNSGATWVSNNVPKAQWEAVAASADASRLAAAAYNGGILISTNSGTNWTWTSAPMTNWLAIASSADGSRLTAAAYGGGIYISTNWGMNWNKTDAPNANWFAVASSADGSRLAAVVYGGGIYSASSIPAPVLNIARPGHDFLISWVTPSRNFVIQQTLDLLNWGTLTNAPGFNYTNLENEVTVAPSNSRGFYRLVAP